MYRDSTVHQSKNWLLYRRTDTAVQKTRTGQETGITPTVGRMIRPLTAMCGHMGVALLTGGRTCERTPETPGVPGGVHPVSVSGLVRRDAAPGGGTAHGRRQDRDLLPPDPGVADGTRRQVSGPCHRAGAPGRARGPGHRQDPGHLSGPERGQGQGAGPGDLRGCDGLLGTDPGALLTTRCAAGRSAAGRTGRSDHHGRVLSGRDPGGWHTYREAPAWGSGSDLERGHRPRGTAPGCPGNAQSPVGHGQRVPGGRLFLHLHPQPPDPHRPGLVSGRDAAA